MCETGAGLCCVSEPWTVPEEDVRWFASDNGRAAIVVNPNALLGVCVMAKVATNFVAVRYRRLHVVSVYLSPNVGIGDFEELLVDLGDFLRTINGEVIIGGDFNAKSTMWGGARTDRRGALLANWAAELDLRLCNTGDAPTCTATGHFGN